MSREAFVPPTLIQPPSGSPGQPAGASSGAPAEQAAKLVKYRCGECNKSVMLRRNDPVRCDECGHRVLYKERTNRMVQFEAR